MNNLDSMQFENLNESELRSTVGGDSIFREAGRAVGRFFRSIADGDNTYPPTFM